MQTPPHNLYTKKTYNLVSLSANTHTFSSTTQLKLGIFHFATKYIHFHYYNTTKLLIQYTNNLLFNLITLKKKKLYKSKIISISTQHKVWIFLNIMFHVTKDTTSSYGLFNEQMTQQVTMVSVSCSMNRGHNR